MTIHLIYMKVNGKDVSSASHEDTIAAFTTAQEPIIVEVLKRQPKQQSPQQRDMGSIVPIFNDTSTQTEWTGMTWDPQSAGLMPFTPNNQLDAVMTQGHMLLSNDVDGNHYSTIGGDPEVVDDHDGCEVEYEEVTLHRSPTDSKLGLTLGYGAPDEPDTDVYISEIEADSIAAKNGKIQKLDQLLQVNGVDVRSRDQVVNLFSERRPDFTLLLARTQMPVEEFLLDEHVDDFQGFNVLLEHEEEGITTDTGTTENAHLEKDSGVGRTDESTKNDESSDHEAADNFSYSGDIHGDLNSIFGRNNCTMKDSDCCTDDIILKQEMRRFHSEMSNKGMTLAPLCRFQSDASLDREMALLNKEMENIQLECETLVHRHLESQQKGLDSTDATRCQLEHVYVNLTDLHAARAGQDQISPLSKKETVERWVNSMFLPRQCPSGQQDRDSSSAYNTADSSGSGPLTLELTPMARFNEVYGSVMSLVSPKMEDKGTQLRDSDVASMFSCDSCRRCCKALVERENVPPVISPPSKQVIVNNNIPNIINSSNNKATLNRSYQQLMERDSTFDRLKEERNRNYVSFFPAPNTMYTNQANLQHTIWLQQQMLRQAMTQQQVSKSNSSNSGSSTPNSITNRGIGMNSKNVISSMNRLQSPGGHVINGYHMSSSPSKSGTLSTVHEDEEMKMEWKVKRRADGTRYITRKPARKCLLKARAMKILEERAGITTDDDAMSELKTGRYWTKEERKRHLEEAKERKRKGMVIRSKMASVKEQGEDGDDTKKEVTILELSHKKMMKRRGKVVFDDFTTIQEVLAHGAKITNPGTKPLGLLTVTTV